MGRKPDNSRTVNGNLHVKNNLHLESTARVKGDMELHSLVTDEGAIFEGNCKMAEVVPESDSDNKKKLELAQQAHRYGRWKRVKTSLTRFKPFRNSFPGLFLNKSTSMKISMMIIAAKAKT